MDAPSYKLTSYLYADVRGFDKNEEKNESIQRINLSEEISGVTAYQIINSSYTDAGQKATFLLEGTGMKRVSSIYFMAEVAQNSAINVLDGATVLAFGQGITFMNFDNKVIPSATANDAVRMKIVGDDALETDLFIGASSVPLTVYDIVPLLQADLNTKVPTNTVVFSVSDRMGIRADVTGSTGNTITFIAPTGEGAVDVRLMLFGDAGASSENLTADDSAFEGRVLTYLAPADITIEIVSPGLTSRYQMFVVGAR